MLKNSTFQRRVVLFLIVCFAVSFVAAPMLFAQDEDGGDAKKPKSQSLLSIIAQGGAIGWFIILMSVVGFALMVEHAITIRRDNLVPPELLGHIEALFEDEEYEEVMNICEAQPTFLTNVIASALPRLGGNFEHVENAIIDATEQESLKLNQKIGYISLIANLAPMLGLLGTVTGMIAAFQVIANSEGSPSPAALADSIGMALVTTALGLVVAIPLTAGFFYFRNKVIKIQTEVMAICEELFDRFRAE